MNELSQNRADASRARLLEAAVEAFAAKGFHGTTTRDIATAAGMSPAALYVHHRSKEELLYQISLAGHQRNLQIVRDAIASAASPDPRGKLEALIRGFATFHAENHTVARILNYEMTSLSAEHHAEVLAVRRTIDAELRAIIDSGVVEGAFTTPDARMTTTALLSLGIDIARWFSEGGPWSPEQIANHYVSLAVRMVGAH